MTLSCPFCGSERVDHHHDHEDPVADAIEDGTPVYKCQGCLGMFPDESEEGSTLNGLDVSEGDRYIDRDHNVRLRIHEVRDDGSVVWVDDEQPEEDAETGEWEADEAERALIEMEPVSEKGGGDR